jgi:hypothetical protein
MRPSFIGHIMNGLLLFFALWMFYNNWNTIDKTNIIIIIILLSIAIGIHSILHHCEEIYYDFNPLENKWIPKK